MRSKMKRVAILPWPGIEGAYLCLSGRHTAPYAPYGPGWSNHESKDPAADCMASRFPGSEPCVTFTWIDDVNGVAVEWDGHYGPIQRWQRDDKTHDYDQPRSHWIWKTAYGVGAWSQTAVEKEGLDKLFIEGEYEQMFDVLKRWGQRR